MAILGYLAFYDVVCVRPGVNKPPPKAACSLLTACHQQYSNRGHLAVKSTFEATYVEVYNDKTYDLLADAPAPATPPRRNMAAEPPKRVPRRVREHKENGPFVEGALKRRLVSVDDVHAILEKGEENRQTGETAVNTASSRSHTLLTIWWSQKFHDGNGTLSKVVLVDLVRMGFASRDPPPFRLPQCSPVLDVVD